MWDLLFEQLYFGYGTNMTQEYQRKTTCELLITERGGMYLLAPLIPYCVQHIVHVQAIV